MVVKGLSECRVCGTVPGQMAEDEKDHENLGRKRQTA